MIKYQLVCDKSHEFEGWFGSSAAYDKQRKRKLVTCPVCGSAKVEKALMAPNVVTSEKAAAARPPVAVEQPAPPTPPAMPPRQLVASPEQREMMQKLRRMRDEILAKSEYVGPRFAEEARRIHTEGAKPGESERTGIHGEASLEDVKSLAEDGIDVFPVPVLPDDRN